MASIEVYTTPYCPYCVAAKELLRRKGADFREINVAGNRDLRTQMVDEGTHPLRRDTVGRGHRQIIRIVRL